MCKKVHFIKDLHDYLFVDTIFNRYLNSNLNGSVACFKMSVGSLWKLMIEKYLLLAAAAKSLQSCLTLCDPIDGRPPGSAVPGILQARTLEWVAISFSSAWKWKVKMKSVSHVWLFVTPWTEAYQAPPSMEFSRQEYWSGLPLSLKKRFSLIFLKSSWKTSEGERDGGMASLTQWTWVWASSGRWWRTGKTGMLQSMGSQNWTRLSFCTTTKSQISDTTFSSEQP